MCVYLSCRITVIFSCTSLVTLGDSVGSLNPTSFTTTIVTHTVMIENNIIDAMVCEQLQLLLT